MIKRFINVMIRTEEWPRGSKTLSENQLAIKFGCSRLTARQALKECVDSGLLISRQGRGYFVSLSHIKMTAKSNVKTQFVNPWFTPLEIENFQKIFDVVEFKKRADVCLYKTYSSPSDKKTSVLKSFIATEDNRADFESISHSVAQFLQKCNIEPVQKKSTTIFTSAPQTIVLKLGVKSGSRIPTTYSVLLDEAGKAVECSITYTDPDTYIHFAKENLTETE